MSTAPPTMVNSAFECNRQCLWIEFHSQMSPPHSYIYLVVNRETVVERKKTYERTEGSGDWGTENDENDAHRRPRSSKAHNSTAQYKRVPLDTWGGGYAPCVEKSTTKLRQYLPHGSAPGRLQYPSKYQSLTRHPRSIGRCMASFLGQSDGKKTTTGLFGSIRARNLTCSGQKTVYGKAPGAQDPRPKRQAPGGGTGVQRIPAIDQHPVEHPRLAAHLLVERGIAD